MKIGVVDLDTSHPANWVPIIKQTGHDIVAVFDHGDVHPPGYADQFVLKHGGRIFGALHEMVDAVDCVIIHGCDWEMHVNRARPFIEAGKAVFVDKPIAGNLSDLHQFAQWAQAGARITGGSSLRFCNEARQFLNKPIEQRGTPHTVLCGCAVDDFNYGIHAYTLLAALMGDDAVNVRHVRRGPQRRVQINWPDGRVGWVVVGETARWIPFHAAVVTELSVKHFVVDNGNLYRALLEAVLPYLAGDTDRPPLSPKQLIAPELWALAAELSAHENNREVSLDELSVHDVSYNGAAFTRAYRLQRYPNGSRK